MEELFALKDLLLKGDIPGSLAIVEELEEMSKKNIINNIRSFAVILLLHLIKQQVENRSTGSGEVSIRNSVLEIQELNQRPKSKGFYLDSEDLRLTLEKAFRQAINKASLEIDEERYEVRVLEQMVDREEILDRALALILQSEGVRE
ncbi:MAG: DUF29 family protein [Hormoscilla sp. GM7CHS1pb]|nr:DUF29 family protein [Hormoscilla sp. GM7CHS1pb]